MMRAAGRSGAWRLAACAGLVWFCGLAAPTALAREAQPSFRGTVMKVTDGDSLRVRPADGGEPVTVRIVDIDAPEICQAWGPQARDALRDRLERRIVIVSESRPDAYGRRLARIATADEPDIGRWMVSQGHAWSWNPGRGAGPYGHHELMARLQRRGLWAEGSAMEPRDFRRSHGPCHR